MPHGVLRLFAWCAPPLLLLLCRLCAAGVSLPSIVILLADDLGYGDVGWLKQGTNVAKTPELDAMAASDGVLRLTRFHTQITCTPSRVSIMTGRSPERDCVVGGPIGNLTLWHSKVFSVPRVARNMGYQTAFFGKFPVSTSFLKDSMSWPSFMGFDTWEVINDGTTYDYPCDCFGPKPASCFRGHQPYGFFGAGLPKSFTGGTYSMWTRPCMQCHAPNCTGHNTAPPTASYPRFIMEADRMATVFETFLAQADPNKPVYIQLSFRSVHVPYVASPQLRANCSNLFAPDSICQSRGARTLTSRQLDYFGTVSSLDTAVGRIRRSLRALRPNSWQNTLVVFLSDNGPEWPFEDGAGSAGKLRGLKRSLLEGGIRTPALVEWPARIGANAMSAALTSILDLPATIMDIMGATPPVKLDGQTWSPLFSNATRSAFARQSGIYVCSAVNRLQTAEQVFCPDIGYIEKTGMYKVIFASPFRTNRQTKSQRKLNPYGFYLINDEFKHVINKEAGAAMMNNARAWAADLRKGFVANCANRGVPGPELVGVLSDF